MDDLTFAYALVDVMETKDFDIPRLFDTIAKIIRLTIKNHFSFPFVRRKRGMSTK